MQHFEKELFAAVDKMRLYASLLQVIVMLILFGLAWSKRKCWKQYYSSILFVMFVAMFSGRIQSEYWLWHFHSSYLVPNHILTDIIIIFLNFPPTVIAFLARYPKRVAPSIGYIFLWVVLYSGFEFLFYLCGNVTYHHGWNWGWSVVVDTVMFAAIRLHQSRPLFAWLVVIVFAAFVLFYFHIHVLIQK